jgi:cytosine/adenosine deaminase-related metal-dependent hydrolase
MMGKDRNEFRRLNLGDASFLNGAGLPRVLTLDASGQVAQDNAGPFAKIDLDDVIVFPALVNSHDHLEFNHYPALGDPPYEDIDQWARDVHDRYSSVVSRTEAIPVELRRLWGMLKNMAWGVTTLMDHGEPHDSSSYELPVRIIQPFRFVHRADSCWAWLGARYKRGKGPLVFHVGEGSSEKVARRSARFLRLANANGPLIGVHGISLQADDARYLDALVWCPASNQFLFGKTADVASLKGETEILFGTDASISANGSIWDHLRIARADGGLSDVELLNSVTTTAIRVWGLTNFGDMVIAKRNHADPWESLFQITPADICAVIAQNRLALMSEDFYDDIAPESWDDTYKTIRIGAAKQRIYCPASSLLSNLASLEDAPLTLQ